MSVANDIDQMISTACKVATDGNGDGNGSTVPITLAKAIILAFWPGVTIELASGTYTGEFFNSIISGNPQGYVTIQPATGATVIIDGLLAFLSDYVTLKNCIVTNSSNTDRDAHLAKPGVNFYEKHCKLINCIIYDSGGSGVLAYVGDIYGCIIMFNGSKYPGTQQEHGIYIGNPNQSIIPTVKHNIVYCNFGWGIHFYANNYIYNARITENIVFHNGEPSGGRCPNILLGCTGPVWPIYGQILRNEVYIPDFTDGIGLRLGQGLAGSQSCFVQENYIAGGQYPF
jgi:hypothetical protein